MVSLNSHENFNDNTLTFGDGPKMCLEELFVIAVQQDLRYVAVKINTCNENLDFVDRVVGGCKKFCARERNGLRKYKGGGRVDAPPCLSRQTPALSTESWVQIPQNHRGGGGFF